MKFDPLNYSQANMICPRVKAAFKSLTDSQFALFCANGLRVTRLSDAASYVYIDKNPAGTHGTPGTGFLVPMDLLSMDPAVAFAIRRYGAGSVVYLDTGLIQPSIPLGFTMAEHPISCKKRIEITPKIDGMNIHLIYHDAKIFIRSRYGEVFVPQSRPYNIDVIEEQFRAFSGMLRGSRIHIDAEFMTLHTSFPASFKGGECVVLSICVDDKYLTKSEILLAVADFSKQCGDSVFVALRSYSVEIDLTPSVTSEILMRLLDDSGQKFQDERLSPHVMDLFQEGLIATDPSTLESIKFKDASWMVSFKCLKSKGFALSLECLKRILFHVIDERKDVVLMLSDLFKRYDEYLSAQKQGSKAKFDHDLMPWLQYQLMFTPDKWVHIDKITEAVKQQSLSDKFLESLSPEEKSLVKFISPKEIKELSVTQSKDGSVIPKKILIHCLAQHVARCFKIDLRIVIALIPVLCVTPEGAKCCIEARYPVGDFPGHSFPRGIDYLGKIQPVVVPKWHDMVKSEISAFQSSLNKISCDKKIIVVDIDGTVITDGKKTVLVDHLLTLGPEYWLISVTGTHYSEEEIERITGLKIRHYIKCPDAVSSGVFKGFVADVMKSKDIKLVAWFDDARYVCKHIKSHFPYVTCVDDSFFGKAKSAGFVVALSGKIASGKSCFAKKLASMLYADVGKYVAVMSSDIAERMEREGRDPEACSVVETACRHAEKGVIVILDLDASKDFSFIHKKIQSSGVGCLMVDVELKGDLETQISQIIHSIQLRDEKKESFSSFPSHKDDLRKRLLSIYSSAPKSQIPDSIKRVKTPGFQILDETESESLQRITQEQKKSMIEVCDYVKQFTDSHTLPGVVVAVSLQLGDLHVTMKYGVDYLSLHMYMKYLQCKLHTVVDGVYAARYQGRQYEFALVRVLSGDEDVVFDVEHTLHITLKAEAAYAKDCQILAKFVRKGIFSGDSFSIEAISRELVLDEPILRMVTYGI